MGFGHSSRQVGKSMEHFKLQGLTGGEFADDKPGLAEPLPETLNGAEIDVGQSWRARGLRQQEHQPRQLGVAGDSEFSLRIGGAFSCNHRAVSKSNNSHVNIARKHLLPAVICRSVVSCSEITHIDRRQLCTADLIERCLYKRPDLREPSHIRGMAE